MLLRNKLRSLTKTLSKPIPLYMAIILALNVGLLFAISEYLVLRKTIFENLSSQNSEELVQSLKSSVLSSRGYTTSIFWGDIGRELVEAGAIDEVEFKNLINSPTDGSEDLDILEGGSAKAISINENNSRLVLNILWALGLTQKSKVLDEGPMKNENYDLGNFASTGGWTLGKKDAVELYSSQNLVELNDFQQDLVQKIAETVYRPCCDNHTAFPDCNHGMAALGLIELEVAAGVSEEQIYKDLLAFNSFWFSQTYLEMAAYFSQQGEDWGDVDPKVALSYDYSSSSGAQKISAEVQGLTGLDSGGGGCGI